MCGEKNAGQVTHTLYLCCKHPDFWKTSDIPKKKKFEGGMLQELYPKIKVKIKFWMFSSSMADVSERTSTIYFN